MIFNAPVFNAPLRPKIDALLHKQQRVQVLSDAMDADLANAQALIGPGKPLSVFYLDSEVNGLDSESRRGFVTALLAAASRACQLLTTDPMLSRLRAVRENRMIDIPFTHLVPTVGSANVVLGLARQFRDMRQELSPTL